MRPVKSMTLIQKYLTEHGYTLTPLTLGQSPHSAFILIKSPSGRFLTLSVSGLIYPFAASSAKEIIDNKIKSYDFAQSLGITIPDTLRTTAHEYNVDDIKGMLQKHPQLIVKPHNGFQSRGLTVDITTEQQLTAAIELASEISSTALIQQQVYGEEIRLIAIDGTIRAALLREKPHLVGDGVSTVAQLIQKENEQRRAITDSLVPYPQLDEALLPSTLLTSKKVLKDGERLELNNKTMIRGGASIYDIFSTIDPSYIAIAQRATEKFGKGLVGIDLMIQDYTVPATPDNYVFIEFNGSISLPMCYSCRDGKQFRIVEEYIGPMLEKAIN